MKLNELKAEVARKELTLDQLSKMANIARTTLWKRFNNTEEFTLIEINNIAKALELSGTRIMEIFFDEKVS